MDAGIHNLYALYTLEEIHVPGVSLFFICESRDQKNKHKENNKWIQINVLLFYYR